MFTFYTHTHTPKPSISLFPRIEEYYTHDSIDNLSDHIPLFFELKCIVQSTQTVLSEPTPVMQSKPVWGLAEPHHIQKYQVQLNKQLYKFLPTDNMFVETDSLCLKQECITKFHDNIIDLFLRPCLCYQLQSIEQNMYVLL